MNTDGSRARELTNSLSDHLDKEQGGDDGDAFAVRECARSLVLLLSPMIPHLSEELWNAMGEQGLVTGTAWPEADAALSVDDMVTIVVQVNGKLKGTIELPRGAEKPVAEEAAMAQAGVVKAIEGKTIKRVVVVPDRIVNIVV